MDDLENILNEIFEIKNIDEIRFKRIKINSNKIIYFIFKESQRIIKGQISSGSIEPEAFILKMADEYYYCPLNDKEFDENLVREFANYLIRF